MRGKTTKVSGARGKLHRLLFVNPKIDDMDMLANRLIALKMVQEILLDSHEQGYLAKIRFIQDREPKNPKAYIAANISKDFGRVVRG